MPDFKVLESESANKFELLIKLLITESENVMGPKFTTVNNENIQVAVQQRDGGIKVGLRAEDFADFVQLKIHFNFEIQNLCGDVYKSIQLEAVLSKLQIEACSDEIRKPRELCYTENVYFFDSYIIHCCIRVDPLCALNFTRGSTIPSESLSQLQRDFRSLLNNKRSSDVALAVDKEIVLAHKNILSSRSPVFKKMFEQQEVAQNVPLVDVIELDIEKSVLEAILLFLYTGIVDSVELNTVMALYSAADNYDIRTLKTTCSNILVSKMTTGTVLSVLRLADLHNDIRLKNIAADFVRHNLEEVEATEEWKHLVKTDAYLFAFISRGVSSKLATKRKREN